MVKTLRQPKEGPSSTTGTRAANALRWSVVSLSESKARSFRLDASAFVVAKHVREAFSACRWPLHTLTGPEGFAYAYHRPRFKRVWVKHSALPILQPSQVLELQPRPDRYLSPHTNTDIEALKVRKGQVLLSCSGTLGQCTLVSRTLDGCIFSHDLIRINSRKEENAGYLYAFLRSPYGQQLVASDEYGAVVSHIEPSHLDTVPVPNPPDVTKRRVSELVARSYALRDESNSTLHEARTLLLDALRLPALSALQSKHFGRAEELRSYRVKLSGLSGRLDASFHVPLVSAILERLRTSKAELLPLGEKRISSSIKLPGRFARVYVDESHGTVFFGGKHLLSLAPPAEKFLSLAYHGPRIRRDLQLRENTILVTRSGTIAKTALVPAHWREWVANEHMIRVLPASEDIAGYIYVYLTTDFGTELVKRHTYGAVVDEIDDRQLAQVPVPLAKDTAVRKKVNRLALEASSKRTAAFRLEQEAIRVVTEEVVLAT